MASPQWAIKTLDAAWDGLSQGQKPILTWRRSPQRASSGHAKVTQHPVAITVTAGTKGPRHEQKLVLLHEIAHAMCPPGENHGDLFWLTAWSLYRKFKIPIKYARNRESTFKGSEAGYRATSPRRKS